MTTVLRPPASRTSVLGTLTSTDHKHVGLLTAAVGLFFFALAGLVAVLMRTELAQPGLQVVSDDAYNQLFTIHGSTMFYLFASPVAMAFALYLVPLQIGAAQVVWPRLALLG